MAPFVEFNPVEGDQVKSVAPEAEIVTESPEQIDGLTGETEIVRGVFTTREIETGFGLVHPFEVPVTK